MYLPAFEGSWCGVLSPLPLAPTRTKSGQKFWLACVGLTQNPKDREQTIMDMHPSRNFLMTEIFQQMNSLVKELLTFISEWPPRLWKLMVVLCAWRDLIDQGSDPQTCAIKRVFGVGIVYNAQIELSVYLEFEETLPLNLLVSKKKSPECERHSRLNSCARRDSNP